MKIPTHFNMQLKPARVKWKCINSTVRDFSFVQCMA